MAPANAARKPASYATFAQTAAADGAKASPENAPFLSWLLFSYAYPTLAAGNQRQLHQDDLWPLEGKNQLQRAFDGFYRNYSRANRPAIVHAIATTYGPEFVLYGAAALLSSFVASVVAPLALYEVITAFSVVDTPVDVASVSYWLVGFLALKLLDAVVAAHANFRRETVVVKLLAGVKMLVLRKVLRRSAAASRSAAIEPQTLLSTDSNTLMHAAFQVNNLWLLPLEAAVIMALLHQILGLAAFAGAAVVLCSVLAGAAVARVSGVAYGDIMKHRDVRMKTVKQVMGAIQTVKLNAWDDKFSAKILALRVFELACIKKYLYLAALTTFVLWASPIFVSAVSFAVYVLVLGETLTAAKAFTAIALFNALRSPLRDLPGALQVMTRAQVSVGRFDEFLALEEFDHDAKTNANNQSTTYPDDTAIRMSGGAFSWSTAPTLSSIDLTIRKGQLVVVHGPVGSGKSSLLSAILGEMKRLSGSVFVRGRVAYYSQQPWIQNASVRDNILFGLPFDRTKYERVVTVCGLVPDLLTFAAGDRTEIGQKGVTLSGGQKARVSLARACYSDAGVLLLDSPLAAVDAVVQREIFESCICGLLKDKTVVLVTHSLDVIASSAVSVLVNMDGGRAVVTEQVAVQPELESITEIIPAGAIHDGPPVEAKEETREQGRVSTAVFLEYFASFGGAQVCAVLLAIELLSQGFQIAGNMWLSSWTGQKQLQAADDTTTKRNMEVYASLGAAAALMVLARSATIAVAGLRASRYLFTAMIRGIMRSPLRFFDLNPVGRIINRVSEDMSAVDFILPSNFGTFFPVCLATVCQLATAVYSVNLALGLLVLPLLYIYVRLGGFTLGPSREVARLWLTSRSPVLSLASEADEGSAVIRAFGPDFMERVMAEYCARLTRNSQAWYSENITTHWFQIRIKALGCVVIGLVVATTIYLRDSIAPGFVGLAFAYALSVDSSLCLLVERWSWIEVAMVSAERVLEYASLEAEDAAQVLAIEPSRNWPVKETVVFDGVVFNYKPGDAPVLKGVSFAVNAREKVGIVGRTGAGKSSLIMALFRINGLSGGRILLDGVDIATVPLQTLRSRLAIIPQSPVLFKGELREYMDPFGDFSDVEIWLALDKVGMAARLQALVVTTAATTTASTTTVEATMTTPTTDTSACLRVEVSENGDNFSVGERQLLCMARALLAKSRVVVLDEATASIDRATEAQVQAMLARDFRDATVLTIAHRLATVVASDRIVVMRGGQVAEMGPPRELAADRSGEFHRLAKEARCLDGLLG